MKWMAKSRSGFGLYLFGKGNGILHKSGWPVVFGDVFLEGFQVAGESLDDFGVVLE